MIKNSSTVLKVLLTALTAGELPYVEVQWRAASPETPIDDARPAELVLTQPGTGPIILNWEDGLERLAEVVSGGLPTRKLRLATIIRKDHTLQAVAVS